MDGSMSGWVVQDLVSTEGEVELDEQRVPNLEEMDEQQSHQFLSDLYSRHIPKRNTTCATLRTTRWRCPSQASASAAGRTCATSRKPIPPRRRLCRCAECWSRS